MTQQQRIKREGQEELGKESRPKKKAQQPLFDQLKAADEGMVDFLREPSVDRHAALLADVHSDEQRANLVTHLQQSYGNTYVQRLLNSRALQAKLTVNSPDDEYEREADRVANAVTQTPASEIQRQPLEEEEEMLQPKLTSEIQRQPLEEEEEEIQAKRASELQRQPIEEEEEMLQPKEAENQPLAVSDDLETRINAARGDGQPLPDSVQASLEPQFGRDFSQVSIHTDAEADKLSRRLGAEAFTTGKDIFFRESAYKPDTSSGKSLIAHELTHVVQQSEAAPALQRQVETQTTSTTAQAPEAEAEAGPDEARLAAFRAMWDAAVVGPLREAYEALAADRPDASVAQEKVGQSNRIIATVREAYPRDSVPHDRLGGLYNYTMALFAMLGQYTRVTYPLTDIRDGLNPDVTPLASWIGGAAEVM